MQEEHPIEKQYLECSLHHHLVGKRYYVPAYVTQDVLSVAALESQYLLLYCRQCKQEYAVSLATLMHDYSRTIACQPRWVRKR